MVLYISLQGNFLDSDTLETSVLDPVWNLPDSDPTIFSGMFKGFLPKSEIRSVELYIIVLFNLSFLYFLFKFKQIEVFSYDFG